MLAPALGGPGPAGAGLRRLEALGRALRPGQPLVLGRHAGRGADDGHAQRAAADRRLAGDDALPRRAARPGQRGGLAAQRGAGPALGRRAAGRAAGLLRRRQLPGIFRPLRRALPLLHARRTQARYAQALGQDYKAYQLGVGGYDVFFTYGSTRFAAKGVEGADLAVPADFFPITDNHGKGAAFHRLRAERRLPAADPPVLPERRAKSRSAGADGVARFTSYKADRAQQMAAFQTLHATLHARRAGQAITRDEPNLGTTARAEAPAPLDAARRADLPGHGHLAGRSGRARLRALHLRAATARDAVWRSTASRAGW